MTKRLCLIAINPTTLTDKVTGEKTERFKYIFVDANNEPYVAWLDYEEQALKRELLPNPEYDGARAREYPVLIDSFANKLTYKVDLSSYDRDIPET